MIAQPLMKGVNKMTSPILPKDTEKGKFAPALQKPSLEDYQALFEMNLQIELMLKTLPYLQQHLKGWGPINNQGTITLDRFEYFYRELCQSMLILCFEGVIPALHRCATGYNPNEERLAAIKTLEFAQNPYLAHNKRTTQKMHLEQKQQSQPEKYQKMITPFEFEEQYKTLCRVGLVHWVEGHLGELYEEMTGKEIDEERFLALKTLHLEER